MPWSVGGVSRAGRVCFSADLVNESNRCYWVPDPAGSRIGPGLRLVSCRRHTIHVRRHGVGGDLSSALVLLAGGRFRDQDHLLSVFGAHSSKARKPSLTKGRRRLPSFFKGSLTWVGRGHHVVVQVAYHVGQGAYLLVTGPIDFSALGRPVPAHQVEQEWLVG